MAFGMNLAGFDGFVRRYASFQASGTSVEAGGKGSPPSRLDPSRTIIPFIRANQCRRYGSLIVSLTLLGHGFATTAGVIRFCTTGAGFDQLAYERLP